MRDEHGFALTEVLLGLVIIGGAVASLLGAIGNLIVASDVHAKQGGAQYMIRNFAEAIEADTYVRCATSYPADSFSAPAGWTANVKKVEYWHAASRSFTGACPAEPVSQKVTLWLRSADGRAADTLEVVKRAP
ncbi:MAG TPA: type II secretion system protein [Actinomycetota bacterium]|nr:type II secretion system protein [Actinomycetota bacterium]